MRVLLTGGTGMIGRRLVKALIARGDECVVISRGGADPWKSPGVRVVPGDPTSAGPWQEQVGTVSAVVNLAGARIVDPLRPWTEARKRELRRSRVETTRRVVEAIRAAPRPPVLLSGSALGYYGGRKDDPVDERTGPGNDFLARLAMEWEAMAREAERTTRVVLLRTGLVLSPEGGLLEPLLPLFKAGLGGPWGNGRQWLSWIHRDDATRLILHALDTDIRGALNVTAPKPVTVNSFASALGNALGRPAIIRAPALALRVALGEAAVALLELQRVIPRRALDAGFRFGFPDLEPALADLLGRS